MIFNVHIPEDKYITTIVYGKTIPVNGDYAKYIFKRCHQSSINLKRLRMQHRTQDKK